MSIIDVADAEATREEDVRAQMQYIEANGGIDMLNTSVRGVIQNAIQSAHLGLLQCAACGDGPAIRKARGLEMEQKNASLRACCTSGYGVVVQLLLSLKADVNSENNRGLTALHQAATRSHFAIVKSLIAARARVTTQNGLNVLEHARAANASHEVIDVVWEHYLRTNRKKITVAQKNKEMVAAARSGHLLSLRAAISIGAQQTWVDVYGRTALDWARAIGYQDCEKLLLQAWSAAWDAFVPTLWKTADKQRYLMYAACQGHADIVGRLIDLQTPLTVCRTTFHDKNRRQRSVKAKMLTPLNVAVWNNNLSVAKALLEAKADPCRMHKGSSPLVLAAQLGHDAIVTLLLNAGADASRGCGQELRTPLGYACQAGHVKCVAILAPVSPQRSKQMYLRKAAGNGAVLVVKTLLEHGTDPRARSRNGNTALDVVREQLARLENASECDVQDKSTHAHKLDRKPLYLSVGPPRVKEKAKSKVAAEADSIGSRKSGSPSSQTRAIHTSASASATSKSATSKSTRSNSTTSKSKVATGKVTASKVATTKSTAPSENDTLQFLRSNDDETNNPSDTSVKRDNSVDLDQYQTGLLECEEVLVAFMSGKMS